MSSEKKGIYIMIYKIGPLGEFVNVSEIKFTGALVFVVIHMSVCERALLTPLCLQLGTRVYRVIARRPEEIPFFFFFED